jgi:DNA mismatch repair protein MutS
LKVRYNKVFGFYIEITKSNIDQAPEHYIRRQTLTNAERYITEELKSMEDTILGAEQKSISLEYEVFCRIRQQVADKIFSLQQNAKVLAQLDVLSALAEQADRGQYCQPEISLSDELEIIQGRHPVVEKVIDNGSFVPNDTMLDLHDRRVMILTGPNMAGKSTYMRQVALIVLLAQIGSYVPAQSAKIGLTDRIFTRVGASDDLAGGQSTFMVEMNEVAQILDHATGRSLLILDEIGRGTSTYDGLSIAWAVIEQVSDKQLLGCRTLFATHYHELTDLEGILPGVFNSHVAVDEQNGEIVFLHQIREGGSDQSYGIEVARLAGVPEQVVQRSWEILHQLEAEHGGQQRIRIKKMVKPMDGQLDLFASTMAIRQVDELLDRLSSVDVQQLTPLDALNLLYDLQQEAKKSLRKEK